MAVVVEVLLRDSVTAAGKCGSPSPRLSSFSLLEFHMVTLVDL